jgi:hypothetical protein
MWTYHLLIFIKWKFNKTSKYELIYLTIVMLMVICVVFSLRPFFCQLWGLNAGLHAS